MSVEYPEGEEKINDEKSILRVGAGRTQKVVGAHQETGDNMPVEQVTEAAIQADILLELGKIFPDCVTAWRNNTGAFNDGKRLIRFGLPGQADISGILKPLGCRLEIEVKRAGGRQSVSQKDFDRMIKSHGGMYLLCDGDIEGQVIEPIRERVERDRKVVR